MKAKTKKKKKATARTSEKKGNGKVRGVRGLNGKTVCENWLLAFGNKSIKTAAQCTAFMNKQFPKRESAIFHYPNVVIGRSCRGLLDHGKKHVFAKYPVDGQAKKKQA